MFPITDYSARVSHFDRKSDYRDFRGFYVLFWIGLAIMVITTMLRNIKDTGYPLRVRVWALLTANTWQLALSDLVMVGSTVVSLPMQRAFRRNHGWPRWSNGGMPIQSIFQAAWLILWVK
jgi:sterol O-acyltransferase